MLLGFFLQIFQAGGIWESHLSRTPVFRALEVSPTQPSGCISKQACQMLASYAVGLFSSVLQYAALMVVCTGDNGNNSILYFLFSLWFISSLPLFLLKNSLFSPVVLFVQFLTDIILELNWTALITNIVQSNFSLAGANCVIITSLFPVWII